MGANRKQFLLNEIVRADPTKSTDDVLNGDIEETYHSMVNSGVIPASTVAYDPLATDSTRLGRWRSGVANRNPRILLIADSWGDGIGTTGGSAWANVWTRKLATRLRTTYFPGTTNTGGCYIPAGSFATSTTAPSVFSVANGSSFEVFMGFGYRNAHFNGNPASTVSFSFTGTGFDLYYGTNGSATSFAYAIDAGAAVTVNQAAASPAQEHPEFRVQVRGLTAASHTVVLSNPASVGNVFPEGVITFNGDENNGIQVFDCSKTGMGTTFWNATPYKWTGQATTVSPHLVIIALGINDYQNAGQGQQITSATFKANLKTLVANVRGATSANPPSIVLAIPPQPGGSGISPWTDFPRVIREVAAEDGSIAVYDSRVILGQTVDPTNPWGYRSDAYHVNDAGHQAYADGMFSLLTRFP